MRPLEGIFNRSQHLDIASVTFVALLSTTPSAAVPPPVEQVRPLLAAVPLAPALAGSVRMVKVKSSSRDSLRNGTLIGLAVGGVLGFFAGATGCGAGEILSMTPQREGDCTGAALMGTAILGAVGAGIGAGVDALFEKAPSPTGLSQGYRRGVRVHLRW